MPTISLCMIVKDEEKFLEQCLNSVKNLVDEMVILVDTRSTDKTKEIAAQFTSKIYDLEWSDDFSAARNESLKRATGDWILILDADEVISERDHAGIRGLIDNPEVGGYILTQRNYFRSFEDMSHGSFSGMKVRAANQSEKSFISAQGDDYPESEGTVGWLPTPIVRLFKNSKQTAFSGIVHEDVSPSLKGKIVSSEIPIHHFGKLNVETWKKKWVVYEKLAEKKVKAEKDYYSYFELGRQYLAGKKIEQAKDMFLKSISLNSNYWVSWFNLGSIHLIQNDLNSAQESLERAKALNPRATAIYSNLGVVYSKNEQFEKAIEHFSKAVQLNPEDASAYRNLGLCFNKMGDNKKAYLSFKKAIELNPKYKETIKLG